MGYPETAEGFMVNDQKNWTKFEKKEFPLKPFEDRDIDIAIDACGVCGSDVHTITGGWGDAPMPLCVGHEVIGRALKVGKDVKTIKVGDRVGVGAQIRSCLECGNCKADQENYCPNAVDTYGAKYEDVLSPTAVTPLTCVPTSTSPSRSPTTSPPMRPLP